MRPMSVDGQQVARGRDAGRERLAVAFCLVGKGAEHPAALMGDDIEGRRSAARRRSDPSPRPLSPCRCQAHRERASAHGRMRERQEGRNAGTHRIAHHMRLRRCRDGRAAPPHRRPSPVDDRPSDHAACRWRHGRDCRARSPGIRHHRASSANPDRPSSHWRWRQSHGSAGSDRRTGRPRRNRQSSGRHG